jgi:hypothetical protein
MTATILVVLIGVTLLFLMPSYTEFPMDDAYIQLVYAENLAETGKLFFSLPDEDGIGATSILWVVLLAAGDSLGLSTAFMAKFLGVFSLAIVSVSLFVLLREPLGRPFAFLTVILTILAGNLAWFALSGMETVLFIAIGTLALVAYRSDRFAWVGILLGLLTLTRPEGLALGVSLILVEIIQKRRFPWRLIPAIGITALIVVPWFSYLYARTGHVLPTSGVGKHLTHNVVINHILARNPTFAVFSGLPFLMYLVVWVVFFLGFTFGGLSLPGPRLSLAPLNGIPELSLSVWAPLAWFSIVALLFLAAYKKLAVGRWSAWIWDPNGRPIVLLLVWTALHNLLYMIYLPVPGTASRYGGLNHIVVWTAIVVGLRALSSRRTLQVVLVVGLLVLGLSNMKYWDSVYTANLEHMEAVRIEAAHFIRDAFPEDERCAVSDIGAIRYHSGRPIIDLGALVDPEAKDYFLNGDADQYLVDHQASCLVIPGRTDGLDEGWLDIIGILGLDETELIDLEQVADFHIAHERWLLGYLPTSNYQASVIIYRLRVSEGL